MAYTSTPKSDLVHDTLRRRIVEGALPPGGRVPSERVLAREFGVNHQTVRRALQGLAENGLVVKRPRSGTFVSELPETISIGLAIPNRVLQVKDRPHPLPGFLHRAAADEFNPRQYSVNTLYFRPECFRADVADVLAARCARGVLLWPDSTVTVRDIAYCQEKGIKVVLLRAAPWLEEMALASVVVNADAAYMQMLRRMLELGHRRVRVVLVAGGIATEWRKEAARAMLREYGISSPEWLVEIPNEPGKPTDYSLLLASLSAVPAPTAVIVTDEFCAAAVFQFCFQRGLRVPEDLAIASVEDHLPDIHPVALTTTNAHEMLVQAAHQAMRSLKELLTGRELPQRSVAFLCSVNWKASLGPPTRE